MDPQFDETRKLLVVGRRLQFAQIPEDAKHQIIIPYNDPVIEKMMLNVHVRASHAGPETTLAILRQRFWLPRGRREVKRVLKICLTCKHWNTQPCQQKMAPLPAERVMIAPPFTNINLYFTGALHLRVGILWYTKYIILSNFAPPSSEFKINWENLVQKGREGGREDRMNE